MDKYQLLGLKSLVIKQRTGAKSPTSSKKPVLKFQCNTSDLLSLTERDSIPKSGLSLLSPREAKNTDGPLEGMIKNIDKALEALRNANIRYALKILQNVEKDLEQAAVEGRVLDRNLVIVCLFNTACVYQAMWSLENCLKYMDAVVYNLNESLAQEQTRSPSRNAKSPRAKSPQVDVESRASKLRRQNLLLKVYLQQSAILSHLERHEEALAQAKEAQKLMELVIQESALACTALKTEVSTTTKDIHKDLINYSYATPTSNSTTGKAREACSLFKDEISYTKSILDFAKPFLQDFSKTVESLSKVTLPEIITMAKKSLTNWKSHLESGKSKSHRKGLSKNGLFFSTETKVETRSLLGVQHKAERLQGFNIEAIMQMNPMRYKDYAQKRTVANDLSRESLEEKVIYQSVIFFIIATEMRFIENMKQAKEGSKANRSRSKSPPSESTNAELYYLKAIEVVCRYITGPCAYIEHIAARYFNHYGKDTKMQPDTTPKGQADQEAHDFEELKKIETVAPKEVIKDVRRVPKENKEQPVKKAASNEPEDRLSKSSTVSLVKKITQQVVEEKKQKKPTTALKSKRNEADNSNSSIKKVPEIKLFAKTSRRDLEDSGALSSERTSSPVSSRRRDVSPSANSTSAMSQRSTKISPRDAPISARGEKEKGDRITPELSYFGAKIKVPKLAIKRNRNEERETVSVMNQSGSSSEAGFMSERGVGGSRERDSVKRVPKVQLSKQEKGNLVEDVDRFGMYKESLRIVNPHNSKDNTPDVIKKAGISHILEKEESLKSLKGLDSSRDALVSGKGGNSVKVVYDPAVQKSIKAREKQGFAKGRDEAAGRVYNTRENTLADFDSQFGDKSREKGVKYSCESVEVFNHENFV